jgi:hypothetical protein
MVDNTSNNTPAAPLLSAADADFIREAATYLEQPSLLMRLANLVGKPIEAGLQALPSRAHEMISQATTTALDTALSWAIRSLPERRLTGPDETTSNNASGKADADAESADEPALASEPEFNETPDRGRPGISLSPALHTLLAGATGAVGGMFGLGGLAIEFPTTLTVMLRSIAATAAREGANLDDPAVRLQCLSVLSLGAPSTEEMESAYLTARLGMAMAVRESAHFVARRSAQEVAEAVAKGTAPALVRLMGMVANRFQVVLTEKVAAQAVPLAGAAAGALINAAFTDHFNTVARYHFGILRLEQRYGVAATHAAYEAARAHLGAKT